MIFRGGRRLLNRIDACETVEDIIMLRQTNKALRDNGFMSSLGVITANRYDVTKIKYEVVKSLLRAN